MGGRGGRRREGKERERTGGKDDKRKRGNEGEMHIQGIQL